MAIIYFIQENQLGAYTRQTQTSRSAPDEKRYLGVPADAMSVLRILAEERIAPTFKSSKLQPFDVVLLVLMKIKQDRQFEFLADDFGIDRSYAGRLFAKYVDPIAQALKDFIVWPADELIAQNVPLVFKARFSDVTCIIDCMEIEIEKPSAPVKQAQTWSSYKSANTLKSQSSRTDWSISCLRATVVGSPT